MNYIIVQQLVHPYTRYDYTNAITIGTIISGVLVLGKSKLINRGVKRFAAIIELIYFYFTPPTNRSIQRIDRFVQIDFKSICWRR